jgi:hypothetical protein
MVGNLEFRLLSAGQAVPIKAADSDNKQLQVECPDPSKPVFFRIENKGDKRLGIDLKLNGTSLLLRQKEASEACRLWVLEPGKAYELKGYYDEATEKNVSPFAILIGDAAKQAREQLGDRAGEIMINIFDEAPVVQVTPAPSDMLISRGAGIRGIKGKSDKTARNDLHSLQSTLMRGAMVKRVVKNEGGKKRELIVEDADETKKFLEGLKTVDFAKSPGAIASQIIKVIPGAVVNTPQPAENPTEKPANNPAEKPANTPANPPANKPANTPANPPANKPANTPANPPANKPANPPANAPANPPANKPANNPANKPANPPANAPANKPANNPANKPANTPADKPFGS